MTLKESWAQLWEKNRVADQSWCVLVFSRDCYLHSSDEGCHEKWQVQKIIWSESSHQPTALAAAGKVQVFWKGHKNLIKCLNYSNATKDQVISKCPFGDILWTKMYKCTLVFWSKGWHQVIFNTNGRFFQILWPSHNILTLLLMLPNITLNLEVSARVSNNMVVVMFWICCEKTFS